MLSSRTASKSSVIVMSVIDDNGNKVTGVTASWELFDARGVSIDSGAVVDYSPTAATVQFEIPAESLTISEGESHAGREIVVTIANANGEETDIRDFFLVVSQTPLHRMKSSFVTYPEALAVRQDFAQLKGWDASTMQLHIQALTQAYRNICRMSFKVPGYSGGQENVRYAAMGTGVEAQLFGGSRVRLATLTVEEFDALPPKFLVALKRAQLAEADTLLGSDFIGEKVRAGITSERVGESALTFSARPYLNLTITRPAFDELARYIVMKVGIQRA